MHYTIREIQFQLKFSFLVGAALTLVSCASLRKTDLGEISERSVDRGSHIYFALEKIETLGHAEYAKIDPSKTYSNVYPSMKFYSLDQILQDHDFSFIGSLVDKPESINGKSIIVDRGASINERHTKGTYIYYTRKNRGEPQIIPLSVFIAPTDTADSDLVKAIYYSISNRHNVIDQFRTSDGYTGYKIKQVFKSARGEVERVTNYILASSKDYVIAIRIQSDSFIDKADSIYSTPHLAIQNLEKQQDIIKATSKILTRCDSLSGQARDICNEEEASKRAEASRKFWEGQAEAARRRPALKELQFCTTLYGTPKDGIQTNSTTCHYR